MAKTRSIIKLGGTLGGMTFVDSRTYGTHTRTPRGTHKPAPVNATLQANADRAKAITSFGKGLLPVLKAEGGNFYQRDLWQALLKRLFGAAGPADAGSLTALLPGLELHTAHPLERLLTHLPLVEGTVKRGKLEGALSFPYPIVFTGAKGIKAVRFSLVLLWTDGKRWEAAPALAEWAAVKGSKGAFFPFAVAVPKWANHYALLLKGEGGDGGVVEGTFGSMGVRVMGSGSVKKEKKG